MSNTFKKNNCETDNVKNLVVEINFLNFIKKLIRSEGIIRILSCEKKSRKSKGEFELQGKKSYLLKVKN